MVHEYQAPVRVHKFPFEMVMAAYERRFPSCPQIPVVVECVVQEDKWSADDSRRVTTRRCQLNVDAPYLLKKMVGVEWVYFIQTNDLDLKKRTMEIVAKNETFASRIDVIEKCKYYVHPDNSEWTCFDMTAFLDVKSFYGLESTAEKIAMKQYAATVVKGKELIEVFMEDVKKDGVYKLKPWSAEKPHHNRNIRHAISREPLSPLLSAQSSLHQDLNELLLGPSEERKLNVLCKAQRVCRGEEKIIHDGTPSSSNSLQLPDRRKPASDPKQKDQDKIPPKSEQYLPKWIEYSGNDPKDLTLTENASSVSPAKVLESPDHSPKTSELTCIPAILSGCLCLRVVSSTSLSKEDKLRDETNIEPEVPNLAEEPGLPDHSGYLRQRQNFAENSSSGSVESRLRCPAACPPTRMVGACSSWEYLMVMLVSVILMMIIMSTPLSIFFGRSRGRRRR